MKFLFCSIKIHGLVLNFEWIFYPYIIFQLQVVVVEKYMFTQLDFQMLTHFITQ